MFLEHLINILEWFLKDHGTLKTGVMFLKLIILLFLLNSDQINAAFVRDRDDFQKHENVFMSPNVWAVVYQPDHWYCANILCITSLKCLLMIIWEEEVVSACIGFHQSCLGASGSCPICLSLIHPLRQSLLKTGGTQWTKFKVNVFIPKRSDPESQAHPFFLWISC